MKNTKQRLSLALSAALVGIALAVFTSGSTTARAEMEIVYCYYAGQPYSVGACVTSVCTPPASQKCLNTGEWGGCASC